MQVYENLFAQRVERESPTTPNRSKQRLLLSFYMMQIFSICAVQYSGHWHCKWGACDCEPQFLILILFDLNSHMELVIHCVGQCRSKSISIYYFTNFWKAKI